MTKIYCLIILTVFNLTLLAQSVDKIEAVLGDEIILTSEIESQYLQYLSQGNTKSSEIKCQIIEDLLFQKILELESFTKENLQSN